MKLARIFFKKTGIKRFSRDSSFCVILPSKKFAITSQNIKNSTTYMGINNS